ncbi:hypothetical protein P7K49_019451 [Saguinus oedipus]|uniref:Uncharacterized protein n=1 Tax=Saguinus oedipus TaxID=9490 RepID=A0ABQ9UY88_SAGOE|nr:hypothetical protein P7K49_019451 [Saguinus oedipus]
MGYFSCEDTTFCEDAPSKGPSIHFLPPIQGAWGTERIQTPMKRQDQIEDKPEQFCKLSIFLAWDADVGSDNTDSIANSFLNGDNLWIDKFPKEMTKLSVSKLDNLVQEFQTFLENLKYDEDDGTVFPETTQKDFQLSRGSPLEMAQVSHQEHDACPDLPKCKPPENKDVVQSPQTPLRLKEHELAEVSTEMPHRTRERPGLNHRILQFSEAGPRGSEWYQWETDNKERSQGEDVGKRLRNAERNQEGSKQGEGLTTVSPFPPKTCIFSINDINGH